MTDRLTDEQFTELAKLVFLVEVTREELAELLRSARLALEAREWLTEHSDITGVALAGAEEAPHIKADRSALRALEALRKEFGLDG